MQYADQISETADDTYRYLNFNQMEKLSKERRSWVLMEQMYI